MIEAWLPAVALLCGVGWWMWDVVTDYRDRRSRKTPFSILYPLIAGSVGLLEILGPVALQPEY